jgi:L-seryl-tRNA(Ser) seleniumtransferase
MGDTMDLRRRVPAMDQLLRRPALVELARVHGRATVAGHLRELLEEVRTAASSDEGELEAALAGLEDTLRARLAESGESLVPVLNATGVVIHTNLGRAPLPAEALARVAATSGGYAALEMDLTSGERGERGARLAARLRRLVGAEAALVVNNNAAAVLLALDTLAAGREVIVSRGELVEIGGSFRIPDVLRKSGARLVEVGTTNRTRLSDYRQAIGPETAAILKVHPSNFKIVGFTEAVPLPDLAALAARHHVPLVEDLGSGQLRAGGAGLRDEPSVAQSLAAGVDLVTFSGDKLLGGPQAGLVAGRATLVSALHRNPLYRALRVDKMTLAALDGVLALYERGDEQAIPVRRMLALTADELKPRAEALRDALADTFDAELQPGSSAVGGGAAPDVELPTVLVALRCPSPGDVAAELRDGSPAVVARVGDDAVLIDLRTVDPADDARLAGAIRAAGSRTRTR